MISLEIQHPGIGGVWAFMPKNSIWAASPMILTHAV
jgi:hypothetical protein